MILDWGNLKRKREMADWERRKSECAPISTE